MGYRRKTGGGVANAESLLGLGVARGVVLDTLVVVDEIEDFELRGLGIIRTLLISTGAKLGEECDHLAHKSLPASRNARDKAYACR